MTRRLLLLFSLCDLLWLGSTSGGTDEPYLLTVQVRNADGSPAAGKRFQFSSREVLGGSGTPDGKSRPMRLKGVIPQDGSLHFEGLRGPPARYALVVGGVERPDGMFEGVMSILLTNTISRKVSLELNLAPVVELGAKAPPFILHEVSSGAPVSLSAIPGEFVVLCFWATECGACQPEMEALQQLALRKRDEWKGKVRFVAISLDNDQSRIQSHVSRHHWDQFLHVWPQAKGEWFDSPVAKSYGIISLPCCYVVHRSGVVVARGMIEEYCDRLIEMLIKQVKDQRDAEAWAKPIPPKGPTK